MNTAEKIKVMQAFEDGKDIEFKIQKVQVAGINNHWFQLFSEEEPVWRWGDIEYRVKPEPMEIFVKVYKDGTVGQLTFTRKQLKNISLTPGETVIRFVQADD